ncbi:hypothetical protein DRN79_04975, partial [Methanosarcinales archaeon]
MAKVSEGGMRVYEREESEETESGEESNPEREREEEAEEGVSFGEILRALRRSRVRTEILMYLYKIYPNASYPAEISRNTGIDPTNILGGLRGMGSRFDEANSLLKLGLVEKIERG